MEFHKILIVEDDLILGSTLKDFFEDNQFKVIHVASGKEAIDVYTNEKPSIVLLDVKLPDISGFEVIEKIHERDSQTPVIMITGTEFDKDNQIKGYNSRATYYLQKPVDPFVLLAQVNTQLNPPETKVFNLGSYAITIQSNEVRINDDAYTLGRKDVVVLSLLLQRINFTVLRKELLLSICESDDVCYNNILDTSISAIRRILKKYTGIELKNLYGEGYCLKFLSHSYAE